MHTTKVLIVGSGPAGYTAAIYAARAMLEPILVTGIQPGGQLTITTDVENYPGFEEPIQGPWLMEQMAKQAKNMGARLVYDHIIEADLSQRPFCLTSDSGARYVGETLLICTGAQARWLGLESEKTYQGAGVSACATCDGFFYRNRPVLVVGGGNTAVEEALYLANIASHVTLVHRRETLRAEKILQARLFENKKITILWDSVVEEILGGGTPPVVTSVRLKNLKTQKMQDIAVDGVFIAIGHAPAVDVFKDQLRLKPTGYIWTEPNSTQTSVSGVFAAGDVADEVFRQAVTAAGLGCMAALEAERFLSRGQGSVSITEEKQQEVEA